MTRSTISRRQRICIPPLLALVMIMVPIVHLSPEARGGRFRLKVVDAETKQPIAARMHLFNRRGKPVKPPKLPFWKDHFVFDGAATLKLRKGHYTFELECGPEYQWRTGYFDVDASADDEEVIEMRRFVDMTQYGWYSGDLHIHRSVKHIELLMRAEDLHVAPVITWWNGLGRYRSVRTNGPPLVVFDENRFYHKRAGEDERDGGALLYFNRKEPLDLSEADRHSPSSMHFLRQAKQDDAVHVDVEKPFWWDVPLWLASGLVDSIGVANNHMLRDSTLNKEAWGRPRDQGLYPGPHGNARWSTDIYYHVLNCGLRIPPSAGSASGVLANPVGYNRVYVYCGDEFNYDNWWQMLREGRVVVTNGPLMRPLVQGQLPGHVFTAEAGESVDPELGLTLYTRDPVEYLELVKNGRVEREVRLDQWKAARGRLPQLQFEESGWFLVRVVTTNQKTFRFASSGPYYVEIGGKPRISRRSVEFFRDWVRLRIETLEQSEFENRDALLEEWSRATEFWEARLELANAP